MKQMSQNPAITWAIIFGFFLLIAFWYVALILLAIGAFIWLITAIDRVILEVNLNDWNSRLSGRVISHKDSHSIFEGIKIINSLPYALTSELAIKNGDTGLTKKEIALHNKRIYAKDSAATKLNQLLEKHSINFVNRLSVEEKAMRSALTCIDEIEWGQDALAQLEKLTNDLSKTLAVAPGNPLLEPSIEQLNNARARYLSEYDSIDKALDESKEILTDLAEYLSLPASIKPVITFDEISLGRQNQLKALKESFREVIELNNAYVDLCKERIV